MNNPYAAEVHAKLAEPGDILIIGTGLTSLMSSSRSIRRSARGKFIFYQGADCSRNHIKRLHPIRRFSTRTTCRGRRGRCAGAWPRNYVKPKRKGSTGVPCLIRYAP